MWRDSIGIVLACILITLGIESLRFDGITDHSKAFIRFAVLTSSYLLSLIVFSQSKKWFSVPSIVPAIFFGGIVWLICKTIWGIYTDWLFLSSADFAKIVDRQLLMLKIGVVFLLLADVVILLIVLAVRKLADIFYKFEPELK